MGYFARANANKTRGSANHVSALKQQERPTDEQMIEELQLSDAEQAELMPALETE